MVFCNTARLTQANIIDQISNFFKTCKLFSVVTIDPIPPMVNGCPDSMTRNIAFGSQTLSVFWTEPTATDNTGGQVTTFQTHRPGDLFPVGTTQVTYTFTDNAGNRAQCMFDITGNN